MKWLLLTSEPVESLAQTLRVIDIYTHRWRIEEFHKAWKTGAGAERQRMEEPDNLGAHGLDPPFVAVRLLQLRELHPCRKRSGGKAAKEAEHVESQSAETVLTPDECQLLGYLDKGKRKRKRARRELAVAHMAIARLGALWTASEPELPAGAPSGKAGKPCKVNWMAFCRQGFDGTGSRSIKRQNHSPSIEGRAPVNQILYGRPDKHVSGAAGQRHPSTLRGHR